MVQETKYEYVTQLNTILTNSYISNKLSPISETSVIVCFASKIRLKVIILMNESKAHLFKVGVRDVFLKSGINR